MFTDKDVIYSYSRKQAIEDGVLVDASELAREAGFRFPVALTRSVWCECVEVPEGVTGQDETGRLWDILQMLRWAIKKSQGGESELLFELLVRNDNRQARTVRLKSHCGPGDEGEPVITIMRPDED
jgi:hypothetical protein